MASDHSYVISLVSFGLTNPDEAGNSLFLEGHRGRWYQLQPYLIATLMSKARSSGETTCSRISAPVAYRCDGQQLVKLVRTLLRYPEGP